MEAVDLFGEDNTRDDLGLGTIRDCLADLLFPGTKTAATIDGDYLERLWTDFQIAIYSHERQIPAKQSHHRSGVKW